MRVSWGFRGGLKEKDYLCFQFIDRDFWVFGVYVFSVMNCLGCFCFVFELFNGDII